jgi:hypothetical protein
MTSAAMMPIMRKRDAIFFPSTSIHPTTEYASGSRRSPQVVALTD